MSIGSVFNSVVRAATSARSEGPSEQEKTQAWKSVMDGQVANMKKLEGSLEYIGDNRVEKFKEKFTEDMQAWMKANPNATVDQITAKAEELSSKNSTDMLLEKMRDDGFFSKLMSRRKELMKDLWG